MLLLPLFLPLLLGTVEASSLLVPHPTGPHDVAVRHFELIDPNRIDPYVKNATRRTMASVFLPIDTQLCCKSEVVPYMPPLTAKVYDKAGQTLGLPPDFAGDFDIDFCDLSTIRDHGSHKKYKKEYPIVILDPGLSGSRFVYSALARSLSSYGYIVFTLDHAYETFVVEFPDGSVAYAAENFQDKDDLLPYAKIRADDEDFLISQLSNATLTKPLFADFPGTFDPCRIVLSGHSLGATTSMITAQRNERVIGAVNLDGPVRGTINYTELEGKPLALVGRDPKAEYRPDWSKFYKKVKTPKVDLNVRKTQHYAFMDIPLLLTVYKVPAKFQKGIEEIIGTLDGRKVEKAVNEITLGILELAFKSNKRPLKNLARNPNIQVVHEDL